jgi:hypothetical protein
MSHLYKDFKESLMGAIKNAALAAGAAGLAAYHATPIPKAVHKLTTEIVPGSVPGESMTQRVNEVVNSPAIHDAVNSAVHHGGTAAAVAAGTVLAAHAAHRVLSNTQLGEYLGMKR